MVYGNRYLTQAESDENALEIASIMVGSLQLSFNAVAGMLGNMKVESGINPGIWENLDYGNMDVGFGIVQWTPASKYINWCIEKNPAYSTYDNYATIELQVDRIYYELENGLQYIPTEAYPMTAREFMYSDLAPSYLAEVFLKNYERAGVEKLEERKYWADYYYSLITGGELPPVTPDPDNPTITDKTKRKGFNFVLFNQRRFNRWNVMN